jgi:hypothetical protein
MQRCDPSHVRRYSQNPALLTFVNKICALTRVNTYRWEVMHMLAVLKKTTTVLALIACLIAPPLAAQPIDKVVAANYPPLMIMGDPSQPGYAVEVLQNAAQRTGRQIDLSFLPFTRAMVEVRQGSDVLMPALFFGKEPTDEFLWIVEIQVARMSFGTLSGPVNDLDAARALPSIVVEQGTTADIYLTRAGFTNLIRVSTPEASARMLHGGRAQAWLLDETLMQMEWRMLGFSQPLGFGTPVLEVPIYLVGSTSLPADLVANYRAAIEDMRADGTLDALWRKYTDL